MASIIDEEDEADRAFTEIAASLSKVADLEAALPYFFDFFKSMAKKDRIASANHYLQRLLKSKHKKKLNSLVPFQILFKYLVRKDDSIIRRQPPEIQKVLNGMIKEIEQVG